MCFYDNVVTRVHTAASQVCQAFSIRYKMIPYNLLKGELSLNPDLTLGDKTAQAHVKRSAFIFSTNTLI